MTVNVQMVFGFKRVRFDELAQATGIYEARLGEPALEGRGTPVNFNEPAQPINCVNCGAPRVALRKACDYCGSES